MKNPRSHLDLKRRPVESPNPPPSCPDANKHIAFVLLDTAHAIERRLESALAEVQLSGPKYGALSVLAKSEDPLTLSDLADRLTCVRSNITQLIDRLEAGGLVKRVEDASDRRSVRAAITPLGRELQRGGAEQMDHVLAELSEALAGIDRSLLEKARATLLRDVS